MKTAMALGFAFCWPILTNFTVVGSQEVVVKMDPVQPDSQLWQLKIAEVTGMVQPASQNVWINGVQATVKPDGTWLAKDVPVVSSPQRRDGAFRPDNDAARQFDRSKSQNQRTFIQPSQFEHQSHGIKCIFAGLWCF